MPAELPRVDLFMLGVLLGANLAVVLCGILHAQAVRRIERRHAFGLRHHPAFHK